MDFMSLITVHYQNLQNLGEDLKIIPIWEPIGTLFNFKTYENKVSYPYYFSGITKSTIKFKTQPQDVVIVVQPYLQMQIVFKDAFNHNKIVYRCNPLIRRLGVHINYRRIGRKYMPDHYRFLTPIESSFDSNNDRVSVSGGTEIIYVRPKRYALKSYDDNSHHVKVSSTGKNLVTGYLKYINISNGIPEKTIRISGPQGMLIHYSWYKKSKYLPQGFKFVNLNHQPHKYLIPNGQYSIYIKPTESQHVSHSGRNGQLITGEILYQDVNQHLIRATQIVTGEPGQLITGYTDRNSQYIPRGYDFVKLLSNHGSRLAKDAIYIVLIKPNKYAHDDTDNHTDNQFNLLHGVNNVKSQSNNINDILAEISSSLKRLSFAVGRRKSSK